MRDTLVNTGRKVARALNLPPVTKSGKFLKQFNENLAACDWEPHPEHSVFTQWDQDFYLKRRDEFLYKYKCFWAVSRTISPRIIIEIGTHAGAGADAYVSGTPTARYIGLDWFGEATHQVTGERWAPLEEAHALFAARGFTDYELIRVELRTLQSLPARADFVVVDAAHDPENEYEDLKLALTADPEWIWVDDVEGECRPALEQFLRENESRIDFTCLIKYAGSGLVIKLLKPETGTMK